MKKQELKEKQFYRDKNSEKRRVEGREREEAIEHQRNFSHKLIHRARKKTRNLKILIDVANSNAIFGYFSLNYILPA